jgi:hypothetical protein
LKDHDEHVNLKGELNRLKLFSRKKWFDVCGFSICYPQGFIRQYTGNIYVDPLESLFYVDMHGFILVKNAKSVPKNRYENCKNHMNFINDKKG